jgi:imidazolonepropionase-like amidohydrolase
MSSRSSRVPVLAAALSAVFSTGRADASAELASPVATSGSLLVRHVRVIDGTGAPAREDFAILIADGRIAAVGPDADVSASSEARGKEALDASGGTALPGLVDAHVHLQSVLGAEVRRDPPDVVAALRRKQLRSYLACGVTTVLDTAIRPEVLEEIRGWLAGGAPGPSFLTLGPPIPASGGYMSSGWPELAVAVPEDLDRNFAAAEAARAFGIKVPIERGFAGTTFLPIHEPPVREAIAARARALDLPIFVHASDEEEQAIGLEMGARALLHLNFGREPSPEFVARMRAAKAHAVTTFSIIDAELTRFEPERLEDPITAIAVPAEELRSARDPQAWWASDAIALGYVVPWLPEFARRWIARFFPEKWADEGGLRRALAANLRAARTLHDAGVPVAIGSDAGNSVIAQFHGTSTLREIELLASTGIPAEAVLAAATRVPARMLRLEHEIGTLEVGKRADLVIVEGDPLADVRALRSVRWTVKSGVARSPAEWMSSPDLRPAT